MRASILQREENAYIMEGLGSFIFVLTIQNSHMFGLAGFAIPLSLFIAIFLTANITGGSHNAGVTLVCYLNMLASGKREPDEKYYKMVVAQIIGGTVAGFFTAYLQGASMLAAVSFRDDLSYSQAFMMEFFYSLPILLVVCLISDEHGYAHLTPAFKGLLVASTVFIAGQAIGDSTGGCINPSVAISVTLARVIATGDASAFGKMWVYVLAPCCAAYVVHNIFQNIMKPSLEPEKPTKTDNYIMLEDRK